jgi:hypothetical protein
METTASSSIEIDTSPDLVYSLLTDLSRISEVSPECYRAEWEDGATGPEVGARFRGYNRNGAMEWNAGCVVLAADAGRLWSFEVPADDGRSTVWTWAIEPTESGCLVTESFDSPVLDLEFFQKINRYDLLVANLADSLTNLKTIAESG